MDTVEGKDRRIPAGRHSLVQLAQGPITKELKTKKCPERLGPFVDERVLAEHEHDQKSSKSPKMECGGRGKPGVVLLMLMSRLGRPVRVVTPPASCLFWSVSWDRIGED